MLRLQLKSSRALTRVVTDVSSTGIRAALGCMIPVQTRFFTNSSYRSLVKPYLLADIGEGITECQVISWSVKPGDRVEQFEPICEVQSDKAAVDITSRFEGIVKKLHYEVGDMAIVGSPLLDIEVEGEQDQISSSSDQPDGKIVEPILGPGRIPDETANQFNEMVEEPQPTPDADTQQAAPTPSASNNSSLLTPAVRRILKENNINVSEVTGTGKDGRILKEDVQKYIQTRDAASVESLPVNNTSVNTVERTKTNGGDRLVTFSPIQTQMFKSMTRSLAVPHFLYTQIVDLTELVALRERLMSDPKFSSYLQDGGESPVKLTLLPFILKALSQGLNSFPILNSTLDTEANPNQPQLTLRGSHDFGLAVDTPNGLLVPVLRDVQNHSIVSLAREIRRLGVLGKEGKLSPDSMKGGTLVVSNIGSIGGHIAAPVILTPMTTIIAIGQIEEVPAFKLDKNGNETIVKKKQAVLSWSCDHRVIDGATVARCAREVAQFLENVDTLGVILK